jgi:hypothetical protein
MNERLTLDKITEDSSWSIRRKDGRKLISYWDGNDKKTLYYYQWVWIKHNGTIPDGYEIHHKNFNSTDDRIENLVMLKRADHLRIHHEIEHIKAEIANTMVCQNCGKIYRGRQRRDRKQKTSKYCSKKCFYEAKRK